MICCFFIDCYYFDFALFLLMPLFDAISFSLLLFSLIISFFHYADAFSLTMPSPRLFRDAAADYFRH